MFQNRIEIETHSLLHRGITFSPKGASGNAKLASSFLLGGKAQLSPHSLLSFLVLSTLMMRRQDD